MFRVEQGWSAGFGLEHPAGAEFLIRMTIGTVVNFGAEQSTGEAVSSFGSRFEDARLGYGDRGV